MTPEERMATIEMHWIQHPGGVNVRVLPDWGKNGYAIINAIRAAVAEEREACAVAAECCELDTYDSYRIKEACAKAIRERSNG